MQPISEDVFEKIPASTFIFADLAGSEGDTALTPKFVANTSPDVVLNRKLEAGSYYHLYPEKQSILRIPETVHIRVLLRRCSLRSFFENGWGILFKTFDFPVSIDKSESKV